MSLVTAVYTTDHHGQVLHTPVSGWKERSSLVITDLPFIERKVYSNREVNVCRKGGIGKDFPGKKPMLFVTDVREAVKESLERANDEYIFIVGSSDLINKALKYTNHVIHTHLKESEFHGRGRVELNPEVWTRVRLINKENEKVFQYVRSAIS